MGPMDQSMNGTDGAMNGTDGATNGTDGQINEGTDGAMNGTDGASKCATLTHGYPQRRGQLVRQRHQTTRRLELGLQQTRGRLPAPGSTTFTLATHHAYSTSPPPSTMNCTLDTSDTRHTFQRRLFAPLLTTKNSLTVV